MHNNKNGQKRKSVRFSEGEEKVLRSPSRLGYSEDIPPIVIEGSWENTSQDSNRDDFQFLDLRDVTTEPLEPNSTRLTPQAATDTEDFGQQTDFPPTPSTPNFPPHVKAGSHSKHFVSSRKFLNEKGNSARHPYEKTVFFVKSVENAQSKPADRESVKVSYVNGAPISSTSPVQSKVVTSPTSRIDSGYGSRQETIRICESPHKSPPSTTIETTRNTSPESNVRLDSAHTVSEQSKNFTHRPKSGRPYDTYRPVTAPTTDRNPEKTQKPSNMSYYTTEVISPLSSARRQEKADLQLLNDRFASYVQKVRLLSEKNSQMDSSFIVKQTRILEEEVSNLKILYERELDAIRQELSAVSREKNNYQLQCEKNKHAAIDFESRLAAEADKTRRLIDDLNQSQRQAQGLEAELMQLKQLGDGRVDFHHLQREMDKLIRENEDHKHRQGQEALLRKEAEDKCHTLVKKIEFNEQVHTQEMAEMRERLEQSQATIISLESRINQSTKNDLAIPDVMKQVREQAEIEFKRYQMESEETYSRNISALKCQMDNDAHTIERMGRDKSQLQGQVGELQAKIRNLEGQIMTLEHQRSTVEGLITAERTRATEQLREMEAKLRDMQELVFTKMREANSERDLHLPLKAEIEAMKILMEEEEKRLQLPLPVSIGETQAPTYAASVPLSLPAVSSVTHVSQAPVDTQPLYPSSGMGEYVTQAGGAYSSQAGGMYTSQMGGSYSTQGGGEYMTQGGNEVYMGTSDGVYTQQETIPNTEPLFTHVPFPPDQSSTDYMGSTRYTYEATPSVNRLQIESPPRTSPRAIGPISRAKSAPVRPGSQVQVVPTNLGQGKDYFDEMFRDLTRETLYTQMRPKSSPIERPPSGTRERPPSASRERPGSSRTFNATERSETEVQQHQAPPSPEPERPQSRTSERVDAPARARSSERPHSSVFHDYTTSTSSATGEVKILEVNQEGKFVRLFNDGKQEVEFGGFMIQQNVGGHPVAVYRFPPRTKFPAESTMTVWSGSQDPVEHQPPKDFVWREQHKWGTGPECTTILCKPNGQAIAWMTAAHRFTKNAYEDSGKGTPTEEVQIYETAPTPGGQEMLTEMNVNLNEPKPEPVYLRREKQTPPSLVAQKHPHGTSTGKETHPQTGQPRPFTYGNDNSSVNRQSRVQSTRPDPVPGQPYAGGSGNRIGSAPLRKYKSATTTAGNIRGSGAIANRSEPGMTSTPPNPFQTPKNRFESGLNQVQSQHHVHFNPPMPRPPLFSTW
ncbi:uncharacterized protein LOC128231279 isoform X3 [Mya arenaria]|uniref:uncharacterized protein LOC128231279 isoform X3 n=1 Tax=Mya arenaria TaxID=6604 RepID=UPI0022DF2B28|nr:uncharacterized protein LOC128231279 isoform X3 [Mya arenaria]